MENEHTYEIWNAIVVGHEPFPTDMLTGDRCWPRTNYDEEAIARSHVRWSYRYDYYPYTKRVDTRNRRYVVNVQGRGNGPSFQAWEACGYTFKNIEYTTIYHTRKCTWPGGHVREETYDVHRRYIQT